MRGGSTPFLRRAARIAGNREACALATAGWLLVQDRFQTASHWCRGAFPANNQGPSGVFGEQHRLGVRIIGATRGPLRLGRSNGRCPTFLRQRSMGKPTGVHPAHIVGLTALKLTEESNRAGGCWPTFPQHPLEVSHFRVKAGCRETYRSQQCDRSGQRQNRFPRKLEVCRECQIPIEPVRHH